MRGFNPSVPRRARSSTARRARFRTVLERCKVVDDGRKTIKNGNFTAETSKLTAKKRKCSSSGGRSSSKKGSEGGLKPSEEAEQWLAAEDLSSEELSQAAEGSSSSWEQSSEEEHSSAAEMDREPTFTLIELSSGDEEPLPSKKINSGHFNPRKTPKIQKKRMKKTEKLIQPCNLQPKCSNEDAAEEEAIRKRKDRLRSAIKTNRLFSKLLTDLMWQEEDEISKMMQLEAAGKVRKRLFSYQTEEQKKKKKVEKTKIEKEIDALWIEMATGSSASQASDEEEVVNAGKNGDDDSEKSRIVQQFGETGTVWDLVPTNIRISLFPHQKDGFEFMWKKVGGSIDLVELRSSCVEEVGGGCIISHAPGTGKTRLTLVFLKAYTKLYPKSRPIVIAPAGMLRTWEEEFSKCKIDIPFHNLSNEELSTKEKPELLKILNENSHLKNKESTRLVKLYSWTKTTSVLGISYALFVKLVGLTHFAKLLEIPGVVVLDEGHYPRNNESEVWNTICKLKTKKRIILSGTPFQNNCSELQNTFKLIRPREERLVSAKLDNLKRAEDSVERAEVLKKAVIPYAHVYKGSILQDKLPGLRNCVIVLNPTEYQSKILKILPPSALKFDSEHKQALVTVHPSLVLNCKLSEKEKPGIELEKERLVSCRGDPYQGAKTWFLVEFVKLSMAAKEKVIIFSQYKKPLNLIKEQLCAVFKWNVYQDQEVIIMSGDSEQKQRQDKIRQFNNPGSEAVVLLASIKACSEGISLVGASRVVLLDVVWNPSVERQAISRAYRLGQSKVVYTYHLMMNGSSEWARYVKQAQKQRLSEFMFSNSGDPVVGPSSTLPSDEEDMILGMMTNSRADLNKLFHEFKFQPREDNLMQKFGLLDQP